MLFAETERGRRRARGAYFLYASTLDAGIAKVSAKSAGLLSAGALASELQRDFAVLVAYRCNEIE